MLHLTVSGLIRASVRTKAKLGKQCYGRTRQLMITYIAQYQMNLKPFLPYGGKQQLMTILTGPAGAGKSTAVKAAEQFCMQCCRHAHSPWMESTYVYTAHTGLAAVLFNDVIICKKAGIKTMTLIDQLNRMNRWTGLVWPPEGRNLSWHLKKIQYDKYRLLCNNKYVTLSSVI